MAALTLLRRLFTASAPAAGIEIAADRVTGVTLSGDRKVGAMVTEVLPDGALMPTANARNMVDSVTVGEAVDKVLKQLPGTPTRVALVVPDSAAKVSLMTFKQIPARAADLEQLVRWQARKTAPFGIEDAQIAYSFGLPTEGGGLGLVVRLMRRDIVEEYETACASAGGHAGVVDLASFSLINAVVAGGATDEADWLLVHVAHSYCTIAIMREGRLILFRNRPTEGNLADLVHQTTMYYEDRLQGEGYGRAFLAASAANITAEDGTLLRRSLERRLGTAVEAIDLGMGGVNGEGAGGVQSDLMAAPIGVLLRERLVAETTNSSP